MSDTLQRHWQTLRLIPRQPRKITASELNAALTGTGFRVTKRTIERDLLTLSASFPLVVDDRSTPHGWSWNKASAALDLPALSPTEALSFLMIRQFLEPLMPVSTIKQLAPYFRMAEQCIDKQGAGSPASGWLKKVAMVPAWQPLLPAPISASVQATVQEALLQGRQIRMRYQRRRNETAPTWTVHPLGLVQRGGVSYLVATVGEYSDIRLLVMNRIQWAEMLDAESRQLADFDLARYIARGHFGFCSNTTIDLVLRFTSAAGEHLSDTPLSADQELDVLPGDRLELRATVPDTLQLRWWLLGFGDGVEVVKPASLRNDIADRLKKAADQYLPE